MRIPRESVSFLTGYRGENFRNIEREAGVFVFLDGDRYF